MIQFRSTAKFDKDASIVLFDQDQIKKKKFSFLSKDISKSVNESAASKQFTGEAGQIVPFFLNKKVVMCVGTGKAKDLSLTSLRIYVKKALLSSYIKEAKEIEIVPHQKDSAFIHAVIEAVLIGTYTWDKYKTQNKVRQIADKDIVIAAEKKNSYDDVIKICEGTNLTRDLINENADTATSSFLESQVKSIIKNHKNVSIEILNQKQMKDKGLGLHLAVNQGSQNEPKLLIVKYNGDAKDGGYTAIIGKGMTFDTGGLNLKPTGSIETMRMDMSGTAAVIGVLKNALVLKLKKNILFVCAIAENVTDAKSYKPGDVLKSYSGKTVEVGNTDAEGRLVLADAISYVKKNYKPKRIIDIATLTGACVVALGHDYTGLVTDDDKFSRDLVRSSNDSDDRVWRLPIYPELKDSLRSPIADLKNIGFAKGAGGAITAAEFLHQFAEGTTWAHLDIAGTSFVGAEERLYFSYGASGAGVRLLTHYLMHHA